MPTEMQEKPEMSEAEIAKGAEIPQENADQPIEDGMFDADTPPDAAEDNAEPVIAESAESDAEPENDGERHAESLNTGRVYCNRNYNYRVYRRYYRWTPYLCNANWQRVTLQTCGS
eukprot:gene4715-3624_t